MGLLAAFIVGALLGWVGTWAVQKRLDDNLTDEVARLQRQIAEYQRQAESPQETEAPAAGETRMPAEGEMGGAATAAEEAGADQTAATEEPVAKEATAAETQAVADEQSVPQEVEVSDTDTTTETVESEPAERELSVKEKNEDEPEAAPAAVGTEESDDFTLMHGVGPKYAESLNAAGITTFDQLANTSPEKLQEILQPAAWHKVDFEDWIAQAKELAGQ
jgi:predicted flap endonuclease-1-like 5' DNA nuclease